MCVRGSQLNFWFQLAWGALGIANCYLYDLLCTRAIIVTFLICVDLTRASAVAQRLQLESYPYTSVKLVHLAVETGTVGGMS
jgi:hypothetical protein